MLKNICTIISFLFYSVASMYGQHPKFMDVELGQNIEFFKYKLSQKGFTTGNGAYQDFLFGKYLLRESRIYCRESNGSVNEVFINYGNKNDFSYSEALKIQKGIVNILIEDIKKTENFILQKDVPTFGSCFGDIFLLKNGYIMVYTDGINACQVAVVYCDAPNNVIYKHLKQ